MKYYPINLDLRGKPCLVVGGGEAAARNVEGLVKAGANVTVIAPKVHPSIESVSHVHKEFEPEDVEGFFLVIAATTNPDLNKDVSIAAHKLNVLVNVVDDRELSDFIIPNTIDREPLTISISTSGVAPFLSSKIRLELESKYGKHYGSLLGLVDKYKDKITAISDENRKKRIWEKVFSEDLLSDIEAGDLTNASSKIEEIIDEEE